MSYYTLIASLPALPKSFEAERCPITWPRLQSRFKMLSDEDAETLLMLIDFLAWDRQPLERTDAQFDAHYESVMTRLKNPLLSRLVNDRINLRMILAGFRRRAKQEDPPLPVGELGAQIVRHWNQSHFGLEGRYAWIIDLANALGAELPQQVERLILSIHWRNWSRLSENHTFSFEAVVLYVARWALVNRWVSQNNVRGQERFQQSLSALVDQHVQAIV
ncbi:DUF2764 family protein [Lacunimicrobium album]